MIRETFPAALDRCVRSHFLDVQEESLQLADSVERVVELVRRAASSTPGIGAGAVFLVVDGTPVHAASVEGPDADRPPPQAVELVGLARRAIRERQTVRQMGLAAGPVAAAPLRSASRILGVVAAAGDLSPLARFLAHAGAALARERTRAGAARPRGELERRAGAFERTVEVVEGLATRDDVELLAQRIVGAAAAGAGFGAVSLWTFRAEDGLPIEIARARAAAAGEATSPNGRNGPPPRLPREAEGAGSFDAWVVRLPRWAGCAWASAPPAPSPRPSPGDVLVAPLAGAPGDRSRGFLLAEVAAPLEDGSAAEDLVRWSALARLALAQSVDRRRTDARVEELRAEKDHVAEIHRMKSQFIAAVSHELRTPLTSITAYAETLQKPDVAAHEETRSRFLRIIHDESRRLTRLVDDILHLATLEGGRVKLAMRRFDLAGALNGAADVIRPLTQERGITLSLDAPAGSFVHGDADLLEQLVVNLLENAVKFSEPGGTIRLGLSRERAACRLVVEDEGPGIPADKLDRVFEQFYQVDGSNTRRHGGAGLGLAICRSIALWHDGRIWVESEEGRGARFVVSLPRARGASASRESKAGAASASGGDMRGNGATFEDAAAERRIVELVVEMVAEILGVETAAILRRGEHGDELAFHATFGLTDEEIREAKGTFEASAPVVFQGAAIAELRVGRRAGGKPLEDSDRRLLELLAERVALVLHKLRESGDSAESTKNLERALRSVIDVRRHHDGSDVGELVLAVCRHLGVAPEETARIHYAALVRDVGMTRVPFGITRKPAHLSARDRSVVEKHPEEGARLLRPIEFQEDVFDIVLAHHEAPSGEGYPRGARGEAIPRGARILAVVDAYAALRSSRPYRPAARHADAVAELRRCAGTQFDAEVVEALAEVTARGATDRRARGEASSDEKHSSRGEGSS